MYTVRQPVLAGTWYPAGAEALSGVVDGYLAEANPELRPAGRALVAVVPHAGYTYSGAVAGRLFGLLREQPIRRLVILAPNHRVHLDRAALSGSSAYVTPLGNVPVDTAAVSRLARSGAFAVDDRAHRDEHAIEIQLPMIQRCWAGALPSIVPILVPRLDDERRAAVSRALAAELDAHTLILVSTDFTHYGDAFGFTPFSEDVPDAIERLDSGAILRVLGGDASALLEYGRQTGITMCGLEAAAVALGCGLPSDYEGTLVNYARSGDRDGDTSHTVSYAALLLAASPGATGA